MKKYLLGISIVLLAVGFSAFTLHKKNSDRQNALTDYVWHKYNAAGTAEVSPVETFTGTAEGAKTAFGCPNGSTVICARAYDDEGTPLDIYVMKSPQ